MSRNPDAEHGQQDPNVHTSTVKPVREAAKDLGVWFLYAAVVPFLPAGIAFCIRLARPQTPGFMETLNRGDLFFAGVVLIFAGMFELGRAKIGSGRMLMLAWVVIASVAIINAAMSVILTPTDTTTATPTGTPMPTITASPTITAQAARAPTPTSTANSTSSDSKVESSPETVAKTSLILYGISAVISALCFFVATIKHYRHNDSLAHRRRASRQARASPPSVSSGSGRPRPSESNGGRDERTV